VSEVDKEFAGSSLDVITAFHLLEHEPAVHSLVKKCFALLKPGGWFVAAVPLIDSFQAWLFQSRWMNITEAPRHVTLPSRPGIEGLFRRVGFDSVTIQPDILLSCATGAVLSLVPTATTCQLYGRGGMTAFISRLLGAVLLPLAMPWCMVENYILGRPAAGIVFGHKPVS
jgi:SAM-dependent methyltransferase